MGLRRLRRSKAPDARSHHLGNSNQAFTRPIGCMKDRLRNSGDECIWTASLYDSSKGTFLNGQYLALEGVFILKNGIALEAKPTLVVWKDYGRNGGLVGPQQLLLSTTPNGTKEAST